MGLSPFDRITQLTDFTNRRRLAGVGDMASAFQDFTNTQLDTPQQFGTGQSNFINDFVTAAPAQDTQTGFMNRFVGGVQPEGAWGFQNAYVNPFGQSAPGTTPQQPGAFGGGGMAGTTGIGALDAHNTEFNNAMAKSGAPANLLKAMVNRESSGNWARDGNRVATFQRHDGSWAQILPFVGITKAAADAWGLNWNAMIGNKQAQIDGMAAIVSGLANKYGGFDNAIKVYFGGEAALKGDWKDENGLSSNYYYNQAKQNWQQWDQAAGYSGGYGDGGTGTGIVQKALEFVGVPYVWGSLPQAGDNPWQTGWDCSAFVNWLDDKFGANELPAGSHYQFQDTVAKGLLVSDPNQLRSGDLVFFDTGNTAGGGANFNRASHVGMYIGNGQFIQAANPGAGTIVSNLSDYIGMYGFLGGRRMGWSGGGAGGGVIGGGAQAPVPFSSVIQKYLLAA